MSMSHIRDTRPDPRRARDTSHGLLAMPIMVFVGGLFLTLAYVAYILWPRWPSEPVALDAPSVPVTIADVIFNIPPAAIRMPSQRRPGTQTRIDLAFLWPSLAPPDPAAKLAPVTPNEVDRVFVTIAASDGTLTPAERVNTIYPRYLDNRITAGPGGLALRPFRDGTPYQGEELLYDPQNPERFLVRCTRNGAASTLGICLYDRRIGSADLTIRFPRDWLVQWSQVAGGLEQLIASLRARTG